MSENEHSDRFLEKRALESALQLPLDVEDPKGFLCRRCFGVNNFRVVLVEVEQAPFVVLKCNSCDNEILLMVEAADDNL